MQLKMIFHFEKDEIYEWGKTPSGGVLPHQQGLREGGSGGTSYPGLGLGGPGIRGPRRIKVVASSFGPNFFVPALHPLDQILDKK